MAVEGEVAEADLRVSWAGGVCRFVSHAVLLGRRSGVATIDARRLDMHSMRGAWTMESAGRPPPGFSYCLLVHRLMMYARRTGKQAEELPLSQCCFKVGRLDLFKYSTAGAFCGLGPAQPAPSTCFTGRGWGRGGRCDVPLLCRQDRSEPGPPRCAPLFPPPARAGAELTARRGTVQPSLPSR
jgi:hypothetical protein